MTPHSAWWWKGPSPQPESTSFGPWSRTCARRSTPRGRGSPNSYPKSNDCARKLTIQFGLQYLVRARTGERIAMDRPFIDVFEILASVTKAEDTKYALRHSRLSVDQRSMKQPRPGSFDEVFIVTE